MYRKKNLLCALLMILSINSFTQDKNLSGENADTALINSLLDQSKSHFNDDPGKSISLATQAKELAEKSGYLKGKAYALKNIGLAHYFQGKYIETLEYWNESLKIFEEFKDDIGVSNLLNNIAAIYTDQGDETKGLEYSLKSLKLAEKTGDKLRILSALNTVGSIYFNKPATKEKSLSYLFQALPLCEEIGNNDALGIISENIGEIYFEKNDDEKALMYFNKSIEALGNAANSSFAYNGIGKVFLRKGDYKQALAYHNKAFDIADKLSNKLNMVRSLGGIANVYAAQKNNEMALDFYNKAATIAGEIKSVPNLKDLYSEMAAVYSKKSDFKNAFKYQVLLSNIKDTLYNIETDKKLGSLQFDFDLHKKQGEVNLLTIDKALTDQKLKRQLFAKRALLIGLGMVLMIALLIYRNYRIKVRTHKILNKHKDQIEQLLLNILPEEVANELETYGHAIPRNYESAAVMFTDFKGFTMIADTMQPKDLVKELNNCFMAFDSIIEKFNIEKIKTIGDSYMCASGIPTADNKYIDNIVRASLEIKDFMQLYNSERRDAGLPSWELRIGIHMGPLVAGVVGKKKYAYDIWGSTVNIASRMESSGEPGKVNISSTVYEMIKDKYTCIYRGKINAKNVGDIDMYFIEKEKNLPDKKNESDTVDKGNNGQIKSSIEYEQFKDY